MNLQEFIKGLSNEQIIFILATFDDYATARLEDALLEEGSRRGINNRT